MSKRAKTSLKLPIFLIVGPAAMVIGSILLYAIANFIISSVSPTTTSVTDVSSISGTSLADGAAAAQEADAEQLFGEEGQGGIFRTITNVLLFLLGSVGMLAFIPCLVIGVILLSKRRKATAEVHSSGKNHTKRDWGDVE